MKVISVNLEGNQRSQDAPSLSPEALAAIAARYSRSADGFDQLYSKYRSQLESGSEAEAIDSIFKFIDYGHASIGDMVPLPFFIDGVSMYLAYYLFSICPLAGGQETSTRYVSQVTPMSASYLPEDLHDLYSMSVDTTSYQESFSVWKKIADSLFETERDKKNFAFDRSRYYLSFSTLTNVMLVQSGREWARVVRLLRSHYLPEFQELGDRIAEQLEIVAPRIAKHATSCDAFSGYLLDECANSWYPSDMVLGGRWYTESEVNIKGRNVLNSLKFHTHRYSPFGHGVRLSQARFNIVGITVAELRDVNRHRPVEKFVNFFPIGFYGASDRLFIDVDSGVTSESAVFSQLLQLQQQAKKLIELVKGVDPKYAPYLMPLGTQVSMHCSCSLAQLIYMIELRTGKGTHFRYRAHFLELRDRLCNRIKGIESYLSVGE